MHVDLRYGKGTYRLPLDPDWDVTVIRKPEMPVLANGKTDYRALVGLPDPDEPVPAPSADRSATLRALYAQLLGRQGVTDADTFVGLGGDSLSYVEMSVRLEEVLGQLPAQWPTTPIFPARTPFCALRKST